MLAKTMHAIGLTMIVVGLWFVIWPMPLFTLNQPYLSWYINHVLMVDDEPGGAGAALPFLWMLTAPAGVLIAGLGIFPLHYGARQ